MARRHSTAAPCRRDRDCSRDRDCAQDFVGIPVLDGCARSGNREADVVSRHPTMREQEAGPPTAID